MELIKKYWFVFLLGIALLVAIGYYAVETNKDKVAGKKVNNQDVVYSIADKDVTADTVYDELFEDYGLNILFTKIQKLVANESEETTDEIKAAAAANAELIISQFKSSYGNNYETQLLNVLRTVGYNKVEDLTTYLIEATKINDIIKVYIDANFDTVAKNYIEQNKPRVVSHILVKMEDSENPTEEEMSKVHAVDEALKTKSFAEVATEYSEDTSASNGGSLGFMDKNTSFVPEFLEAALALNEGEVSQWVKTTYGYHLIKVDSTSTDTLKTYDDFYANLIKFDNSIQVRAVWEKAKELNIDFNGNDELKQQLLEYLGIEE